jgi:L-iditol 2-dehydrogenase
MPTMKAAVLHAPGDLRVEDVPVPVPGPGEALVRVTACGVCGSDLPRVRTTGTYRFPTIPGHEMAGVVEKIMSLSGGAPGPAVGTPVAVVPLIPCRKCKFCQIGEFAQCESYDFLGSRSNGGFAQYVKAPIENLVALPAGTPLEEGALLEPIAVALHAVRNLGVSFGESVAVFGLGAVGNFVAQWARVFGASRVYGIDISAAKVEAAHGVGLGDAFCANGVDVGQHLRELSGGAGVDVAFDASGSVAAINQAIGSLRPFGRLGLLGRPSKGALIELTSFEKILRAQITVRGTWSFQMAAFPRHPWAEAVTSLVCGSIKAAPLVTHRFTLEKTAQAIEMMASGLEEYHKVLVLP